MSKFNIGDTVKVVKAPWQYEELVALTGKVISTHDEWSHGSAMCAHISVDLGGDDGVYRFYTEELAYV